MAHRTLLTILVMLFFLPGQAEHLPGGNIAYTCLGGNQHRFTLTLYRECSGNAMIPQTLNFANDCGVSFQLANLLPATVEEISYICVAELDQSTCNGGSLIGAERYTYTTQLFLSPCNSWTVSWSICCRAPSVNVTNEPGLYLETRINNLGGFCHSSPTFNNLTVPFVCVNQAVTHDAGATDADGHRLRYRLIDARLATPSPTPVNYIVPYYGAEPFTGMSIDSLTGQITFTPTVQGRIVTVVQVDEYRMTGEYIGSVMHDFPFVVTACSNEAPDASSGTFTNVTGNAELTGQRNLRLCAGGNFCTALTFTDPDAGQALQFNSNLAQAFPGATLELSGGNPLTATICWDAASNAPGTRYLTCTLRDDACPTRGQQTYAYAITINAPPDAGIDGEALYCGLTMPFLLVDSLGGNPAAGGVWTDLNGTAIDGFFDPSTMEPGAYTYTTSLFPECNGSALVEVDLLPPDAPACIVLDIGNGADLEVGQVLLDGAQLRIRGAITAGQYSMEAFTMDGRLRWQSRAMAEDRSLIVDLPQDQGAGIIILKITGPTGAAQSVRVPIFR